MSQTPSGEKFDDQMNGGSIMLWAVLLGLVHYTQWIEYGRRTTVKFNTSNQQVDSLNLDFVGVPMG